MRRASRSLDSSLGGLGLGVGLAAALGEQAIDLLVEFVEDSLRRLRRDDAREPEWDVQEVEQARPYRALITVDAAFDGIDDLVGVGRKHRPRNDVQRGVHHRRRDVGDARLGQRVPLRQQLLGDCGHDRRVAGDAARIERRRHDAAMTPPGFAFAGQKPAAKTRLQQAAADLGFGVVRRIVEQHVADGVRFVDDEHAAPHDALHDDVGVEIFFAVSGQRVLAHGAQRLPQISPCLRLARRRRDRRLAAAGGAHDRRMAPKTADRMASVTPRRVRARSRSGQRGRAGRPRVRRSPTRR